MRERFLQTVLIALLWCYMSAVAAASPRNFTGTFELRQALTFYIVNTNGADFTLKLRWRDDSQLYGDRPRLTRVFDPDERLILRHEHPGERIASGPAPRYSLDLPVPARGPGVYLSLIHI